MRFHRIVLLLLAILLFCSCSERVPEVVPEYDETPADDRSEINGLYPSLDDFPTVYIDLGVSLATVTKEEYRDAVLTVSESDIVEEYGAIKGRGNASWGLPQRPYTIKFDEKQPVLGMDEAKKWVLITMYWDKTLLRNCFTLNLAKAMNVASAIDSKYVNVVVNGEYNGLYLLTEKIEDGKGRVDLKKNEGDVLFEIEMSYRHNYDCKNCIALRSGTHITFKDPEPSDLSETEFRELRDSTKKILTAADEAIRSKKYEEYSKVIDVESFVNWYILNEFVKNYDSAFVTSCYCYLKDGILFMGPAWDYDTCLGNQDTWECIDPEGFRVANAPWYKYLTKDKTFSTFVSERWKELCENGVFDSFLRDMDRVAESLSTVSKRHFARWPDSLKCSDLRGRKSFYTYEKELTYLKDWTEKRIRWLSSVWE